MENDKLIELIEIGKESEIIDFKASHHDNKARLLHDILCLANNLSFEDAYLVFGINNSNDVVGIENDSNIRTNEQIIDFLKNVRFNNQCLPQTELFEMSYMGKRINILKIKATYDVPYFLAEGYKDDTVRVLPGCIYTRTGSTNTPIDRTAGNNSIERLWKRRFHLLDKPIDRVFHLLDDISSWEKAKDFKEDVTTYYCLMDPTLSIENLFDPFDIDRFSHNIYSYSYEVSSFIPGVINIKYGELTIKSLKSLLLDSGRVTVPVPIFRAFRESVSSTVYLSVEYLLENTIDYRLIKLLNQNKDSIYGLSNFLEVVVVFKDDQEKGEFFVFIEENLESLIHHVEVMKEKIYSKDSRTPQNHQFQYCCGLVLNECLEKYRNS